MTTPDLPPLRDVVKTFGLNAKKSLGQNFLLDMNLTRRIVRVAEPLKGHAVIEVGPGPGGLTRALLESDADKVIAIERDSRCMDALQGLREIHGERFRLLEADALEIEPASLCEAPRKIVANLPYNIATPLLIGWLKKGDGLAGMTLMFQKEVADRITARPGSGAYGRLSVIAQCLAETERAFNVNRRAFTPPPKVASAVVAFQPRATPVDVALIERLERVTAAAFGQRRKMLRTSLKPLRLGDDLEALLDSAGIDPRARAGDINVSRYAKLSRLLKTRDI